MLFFFMDSNFRGLETLDYYKLAVEGMFMHIVVEVGYVSYSRILFKMQCL